MSHLSEETLCGLQHLIERARRIYRTHTAVYRDPFDCLLDVIRVDLGLTPKENDDEETSKAKNAAYYAAHKQKWHEKYLRKKERR